MLQLKKNHLFDFEKLDAYQHLKKVTISVLKLCANIKEDNSYLTDQLKRSSMSALLNLSEGTGRRSPADKKRFYTMSRSSVFETVTILEMLKELEIIDAAAHEELYQGYDKASRMLLGMYRALNKV